MAAEEVVERGADEAVLAHRLVDAVGVTGVDDRELGQLRGLGRVVERHLDDLHHAVVHGPAGGAPSGPHVGPSPSG